MANRNVGFLIYCSDCNRGRCVSTIDFVDGGAFIASTATRSFVDDCETGSSFAYYCAYTAAATS
jgi:hypothetical protein